MESSGQVRTGKLRSTLQTRTCLTFHVPCERFCPRGTRVCVRASIQTVRFGARTLEEHRGEIGTEDYGRPLTSASLKGAGKGAESGLWDALSVSKCVRGSMRAVLAGGV